MVGSQFTLSSLIDWNNSAELPGYVTDYGRKNLLKVVGDEPSEWCQYEPPVAYSYIQKVGLLVS